MVTPRKNRRRSRASNNHLSVLRLGIVGLYGHRFWQRRRIKVDRAIVKVLTDDGVPMARWPAFLWFRSEDDAYEDERGVVV